jgi:predicted metalloprotease
MRRMAPIGLGGVAVLFILSLITGQDFLSDAVDPSGGGVTTDQPASGPPQPRSPEEERLENLVSSVLDDAQDTWTKILGSRYERAKLVLFTDAVDSACGMAQSATGPFYCPQDHKVYIDLGFYRELRDRFGAPGEFAQAYVLAHELGHHVQTLTGTERQMRQLQQSNPGRANELSVRLELQADCYAGVWGKSAAARGHLEEGEAEQGLNAAAAIGDDRLTRGRVAPERFTHGSSAQRVQWFKRGMDTGQPEACDTFK